MVIQKYLQQKQCLDKMECAFVYASMILFTSNVKNPGHCCTLIFTNEKSILLLFNFYALLKIYHFFAPFVHLVTEVSQHTARRVELNPPPIFPCALTPAYKPIKFSVVTLPLEYCIGALTRHPLVLDKSNSNVYYFLFV